MNTRRVTLAQGIIAERAGDSLLLYTPSSKETRGVDGLEEDVLEALVSGKSVSVLASPALISLIKEGTLIDEQALSRRSVVKGAAIGSAAGLTVLSMPQAAAAASGPAGGTLYGIITFDGQTWGGAHSANVDLGDHALSPNANDVVLYVLVNSPPETPYTSPSPLIGTLSWNSQTFTTYLVEFGGSLLVWMHLLPPGTTSSPIDDDFWEMSFTFEGASWTVQPDLR